LINLSNQKKIDVSLIG